LRRGEASTLLTIDPDNRRAHIRTFQKHDLQTIDGQQPLNGVLALDRADRIPEPHLEMLQFVVRHRCFVKITIRLELKSELEALQVRDRHIRKLRVWMRKRSIESRYVVAVDRSDIARPIGLVVYLTDVHDWITCLHLQAVEDLSRNWCIHHLSSISCLKMDLQRLSERTASIGPPDRFFVTTKDQRLILHTLEVDSITQAVDIVDNHFARPHSISQWNVVADGEMKRANLLYAASRREW